MGLSIAMAAYSALPVLLLCLCSISVHIEAFMPVGLTIYVTTNNLKLCDTNYRQNQHLDSRRTLLFSSPVGDRPPPRRALKKRKNKCRQRMDNISQTNDVLHTNSNTFDIIDDDNDIEVRPVRRRDRVEAGLDYWIDESDLKKDKEKRIALKNTKLLEDTMPKEKLRDEVVAPYKQNWIGIFSVIIVVLSVIGSSFPELLQNPIIRIPDL